jgi:uncharacterized membrane protein YhaH (DUF805 family)
MGTAITTCFEKYLSFVGRAARPEYWYFVLFLLIGSVVLRMLDIVIFPASAWSPLSSIFSLVTFLPSLAVAARRLHDIDKSGWWLLISFIPIIGWIILLIWASSIGTRGPNRFGENPAPATVLA